MSSTRAPGDDRGILCVGMCVADIIHVCEDFPVEDTDKRCKHGRWQRGGNASNNCTVLRQLGRPRVDFLGPLSSSPLFAFLLADMRQRGIGHADCPWHECDAPLSSVILNERTGSRTIVHSNPGVPPLTAADFERVALPRYRWVHFEGRQPAETLRMMRRIAAYNRQQQAGVSHRIITVSLDIEKTALDFDALLPLVDVAFVGKEYAQQRWQCTTKLEAVRRLRERAAGAGATQLAAVCPWGDRGAAVIDGRGGEFECDAYGAQGAAIVDSLGAGDTFLAAVVHALCERPAEWEGAIRFGCRMAGGKIRHVGYDCVEALQREWMREMGDGWR